MSDPSWNGGWYASTNAGNAAPDAATTNAPYGAGGGDQLR